MVHIGRPNGLPTSDRPADREVFAEIFGVGQAKLEQFADFFLEAVAAFEN